VTLTDWKDIATVVGTLVALGVLIKGVLEYTAQGAQKRAEQFFAIRNRLKQNESFKNICDLLERDDPSLEKLAFKEKRDFLGLFEEVTLLMNSGLIRKPVAHYMFGYYAIRCWESKHFWVDVNRNSSYWAAFRRFVDEMKGLEDTFEYKPNSFRF
jgi:hypothetical protein